MRMKQIIVATSLIGYSLVGNFVAYAQDAKEALYTKSLVATCANCHGTNGYAASGSSVSGLAGLPKDYLIAQMKAFKNGTRPATVMHQLAKGFSDAQIEQMAAYFAAQKK
ncbi:MAG: c-type cytochrome [Cytophagales bacterium]|nr:c-type cytochrome [Cytophagales bacterium]